MEEKKVIRRKIITSNTSSTEQEDELQYVYKDGYRFVKIPEFKETIKPSEEKTYKVACSIMVKNEEKSISKTLETFLPHCDCLIVFDTGSTDNTVDLIKQYTEKYKKPLYLITGKFVDFSTSRNTLLYYAQNLAEYLVLPDSNDELIGGENIMKMIKQNDKHPEEKKWNAIFVKQIWETTHSIRIDEKHMNTLDEKTLEGLSKQKRQRPFKNIRIIRTKQGWTYNCVIHENVYINPTVMYEDISIPNNTNTPKLAQNTDIVFFQNRDEDNKKSELRYASDIVLLQKELKRNPDDLRTIFYLGQTNECMKNIEEALVWYVKRCSIGTNTEEKYISAYRSGKLSILLNKSHEDIVKYLLLANTIALEMFSEPRAEPLVMLSQHYFKKNLHHQGYYYLKQACMLTLPTYTNLMVEKEFYDEIRWTMAIQYGAKVGEFRDTIYAGKVLANNLGCKVVGNKIIYRGNDNSIRLKVEEIQKFIDLSLNLMKEHKHVEQIYEKIYKQYTEHKCCFVLPPTVITQTEEFQELLKQGKIKQAGNIPQQQSILGQDQAKGNKQSDVGGDKTSKKKKNKKRK